MACPQAALGASTYPSPSSPDRQATVQVRAPGDDHLALTPPPHTPPSAARSLLGVLGPTQKGQEPPLRTWRLPPSTLIPRHRPNTWRPRVYVCHGFLRALGFLGIAPFAVFEHPQALPHRWGRKLGCLVSLSGGRRSPGSSVSLKGSVSQGRPHALAGS